MNANVVSLLSLMTALAFQQEALCRVVIKTGGGGGVGVQTADCVEFEGCDKVTSALSFISFIFASWVRSSVTLDETSDYADDG